MFWLGIALVLLLFPAGIFAGVTIQKRRSVDYKRRWLEATKLVKEMAMSPLPDELLEKSGIDTQQGKWKLHVEYGGNGYAYFYAVKGKQKKELGYQYSWAEYTGGFEAKKQRYQKAVQSMNDV